MCPSQIVGHCLSVNPGPFDRALRLLSVDWTLGLPKFPVVVPALKESVVAQNTHSKRAVILEDAGSVCTGGCQALTRAEVPAVLMHCSVQLYDHNEPKHDLAWQRHTRTASFSKAQLLKNNTRDSRARSALQRATCSLLTTCAALPISRLPTA